MQKTIPVFFAADENYIPFLGVTLASIKKYANPKYQYKIHVLHTGTLAENAEKIKSMQTANITVGFHDISHKAKQIQGVMRCRDYYTSAIYFRLFIPDLFPQYEKAVYLDCDTVLLEDIANLYEIDISNNYIGAVTDEAVASVEVFRSYVKNALDILPEKYFNSGVIVLNLAKLREMDFYQAFYSILDSYDFTVAPDQDCLNLICKDRVYYYGGEWNKMPIGGKDGQTPKLVHFNLAMKPWHYDGVLYEEYFWDYAKQTPFHGAIIAEKQAFTPQMAKRDKIGCEKLLALAQFEAEKPDNYIRSIRESK